MGFNLIDQPWIPVVTQDFQLQMVSLTGLFQTWGALREIQADNPPTTLALYRLLMAVLHQAYEGPRDVDHWEEIAEDDGAGAIAYLETQRDRFDLLHEQYPFMQDPILPLEKAVPIYALHTMSTSQVFSHEHEWSGYRISLAQAARLLVRLQGCDITSLRAFYVGQSSGNRSAVNTPTINVANVLVRGDTLKQTLLLNLIRYDPSSDAPCPARGPDLPAWETGYGGKPKKAVPEGYISYLTFPWRRLRLFPEGEQVGQLAITMGNSLPDKVTADIWECGVAYREGKPVRLSLQKQLWRNADAFVLNSETQRRPRIVDWLSQLKREELAEAWVTLQISGLSADKAKPLAWSWEQFSAPMQYVTEPALAQALKVGITIAEDHQQLFRSFRGSPYAVLAEVLNHPDAAQLASALGGESRYWAGLEAEFTELLRTLPLDRRQGGDGLVSYGDRELSNWLQTVQRLARSAFTDSILSIRNYQARAAALSRLEWKLADLRASPEEREEEKKSKAKAKSKTKAKVTQ